MLTQPFPTYFKKKMCYIEGNIIQSLKKKEMLTFNNIINEPGIMLSDINWIYKDKHCIISIICGIKNSQTHKSGMVVAKRWELEEKERCWTRSTKLQLSKMNDSADLMHSIVRIVPNTGLHT